MPFSSYYTMTRHSAPCKTLRIALDYFEASAERERLPKLAIDLGCGMGRDTAELLRRGWQVVAIDREPAALQALVVEWPHSHCSKLELRCAPFEQISVLTRATLINASMSLFFCDQSTLLRLWQLIRNALPDGGRFAGHLLGMQDGWVRDGNAVGLTELEVRNHLRGYIVERFAERRRLGKLANGQVKAWHIFHVVARRKRLGQHEKRFALSPFEDSLNG